MLNRKLGSLIAPLHTGIF